jgi:predicted phage terminase large subunit-like protein
VLWCSHDGGVPDGGAAGRSREARLEAELPPVIRAFIASDRSIVGLFGPLGSAKTSAGVLKAWSFAYQNPGSRVLIVRETWPALRDTTLRSVLAWLPDGVMGSYAVTEHVFTLWTGTDDTGRPRPVSEFVFRAMDDQADMKNVLSLEVSACWIDEPQGGLSLRQDAGTTVDPGLREELFQQLVGRVGRGPETPRHRGLIWLTGNPPAPTHWVARLFHYDGQGAPANPDPDRHLFLSTRATNARHLPPDYYGRLERVMGSGTPMARRYLDGEWIHFASTNPFQRAWIQIAGFGEAPQVPALSSLDVAIGIDPAISTKDDSAYSAIVVAGQPLDAEGGRHIFVLDCERGHWSVGEQIDHLLRAARRWQARTVRIEDVAYQRALGEVLSKEMRERGTRLAVQMVRPDADKLMRASAWSPLVEDGTVVFDRGLDMLVEAMLSVPQDRRQWDLVDAAGLVIRGFPVRAAESSPIRTPDRVLMEDRAASYNFGPLRPSGPPRPPRYPGPESTRSPSYPRVVPAPLLWDPRRRGAPGATRAASYGRRAL